MRAVAPTATSSGTWASCSRPAVHERPAARARRRRHDRRQPRRRPRGEAHAVRQVPEARHRFARPPVAVTRGSGSETSSARNHRRRTPSPPFRLDFPHPSGENCPNVRTFPIPRAGQAQEGGLDSPHARASSGGVPGSLSSRMQRPTTLAVTVRGTRGSTAAERLSRRWRPRCAVLRRASSETPRSCSPSPGSGWYFVSTRQHTRPRQRRPRISRS